MEAAQSSASERIGSAETPPPLPLDADDLIEEADGQSEVEEGVEFEGDVVEVSDEELELDADSEPGEASAPGIQTEAEGDALPPRQRRETETIAIDAGELVEVSDSDARAAPPLPVESPTDGSKRDEPEVAVEVEDLEPVEEASLLDSGSQDLAPPDPSPLDQALGAGRAGRWAAMEQYFRAELQAEQDRRRQAVIQHELGHLYFTRLDDETEALKAYAVAHRNDPLLLPNVWAIRRMLAAKRDWPTLIKLLDTQLKGEVEQPSRRAEGWLERGWLLEAHQADLVGAKACYEEAHRLRPDWLPPLLALERAEHVAGDAAGLARVYRAMEGVVKDPQRRLAVLLHQARLQEQVPEGTPEAALELLEQAYAMDLERPLVLLEMERVAIRAGSIRKRAEILGRQAEEALRADPEAGRDTAVASLRQAAMLLRSEDSLEGALELLRRALDLRAGDPILLHDMFVIAEELGNWEQVESLQLARLDRAENDLERAEIWHMAARARRQRGEDDQEAVTRALELVPGYLPVLVDQERKLLSEGDLEGLVAVYQREAEAVIAGAPGVPQREGDIDRGWAATMLWRTAVLARYQLGDGARAIELCRRALDIAPRFQPAEEQLESLYQESGRHEDLAMLLERLLEAADSRERRIALLEELTVLSGGPLDDPERQLGYLRRLEELHREDSDLRPLRLMTLVLDRLGRFADLEQILSQLETREGDPALKRAWLRYRAHVLRESLGDSGRAIAAYQQILDEQPDDAFAQCALEQLLRESGRFEGLAGLLRRMADACPDSQQRLMVLHRLLAVLEQELQRPDEVLAVAEEILAILPTDAVARSARTRMAEARGDLVKLAEALEARIEHSTGAMRFVWMLELAQLLENGVGDPQRAEEVLGQVLESAQEPHFVIAALDALVVRRFCRGDFTEALADLKRLEAVAGDADRARLLEERAWVLAGPLDDGEAAQPLWQDLADRDPEHLSAHFGLWRLAARRRDVGALSRMHAALAQRLDEGPLKQALLLRAASLSDAAGEGTGGDPREGYRRILAREPRQIEAVLGLLAQGSDGEAEEQADLLETLAQHLSDEARLDLCFPLAMAEIDAGRLARAREELAKILSRDPDNLAALMLLQRLAELAGDRDFEARLWVRMAALAGREAFRTLAYERAATLLQGLGRDEQAAVLWRQVLAREPDKNTAYDQLVAIYTKYNNYKALDEIFGWRLARASAEADRIDLLWKRATLRLEKLGQPAEAARDMLRILSLSPAHLPSLKHLADLYESDGNYPQALVCLERFSEASSASDQKQALVLRMVDLLSSRIKDPPRAVEVCERYLKANPNDDAVLQRLSELHLAIRDFQRAVEVLERLGNGRAGDPAWQAANLQQIASIYQKEINNFNEAKRILLKAYNLDPLNVDVVRDLQRLLREMGQTGEIDHIMSRAKDDVREALQRNPLTVDLYKRLARLSELHEDHPTMMAALGVLTVLNAATPEEAELYRREVSSLPLEPRQALSSEARQLGLTHPAARGACTELFALVAEGLPRLFQGRVPAEPSDLGASRSERLDRRSVTQVSAGIDRLANALGQSGFDIYLSQSRPDLIAGVCADPMALIVGHQVVTSLDAARRFRLGRTLSLLRDRAFALEILKLEEIELLFAAAVHLHDPQVSSRFPRNRVEDEAKRLNKALSKKARKALPLTVARYLQEGADLAAWVHGVSVTAIRAGLLLCGDIATAIEQTEEENLAKPGPATMSTEAVVAHLARSRFAGDLLVYSVSDPYLRIRRELGI